MKIDDFKKKLRKALKTSFFRGENLVSYVEAKEMLKENPNSILLDVRSVQEYDEYHLNGAICIPTYDLVSKVEEIIGDKSQVVIVYCQSGVRSKKAASILRKMGYKNVYELDGGIDNIKIF